MKLKSDLRILKTQPTNTNHGKKYFKQIKVLLTIFLNYEKTSTSEELCGDP